MISELRPEGEKQHAGQTLGRGWWCRERAGNSRREKSKQRPWGGVGELGFPTAGTAQGEAAFRRGEVWRQVGFDPALQTRVRNEGFILSVSRSHSLEAPSWGETRDPIYILNRGLWLLQKERLTGGDARLEAGREGGGGCRTSDAWALGSLSAK